MDKHPKQEIYFFGPRLPKAEAPGVLSVYALISTPKPHFSAYVRENVKTAVFFFSSSFYFFLEFPAFWQFFRCEFRQASSASVRGPLPIVYLLQKRLELHFPLRLNAGVHRHSAGTGEAPTRCHGKGSVRHSP